MDKDPDELAIAINLLRGSKQEEFAYERELRMFQFQCWLFDTLSQAESFRQSALRFAAALLSRAISKARSRTGALTPRNCFLLAVASDHLQGTLNHCFPGGQSLYYLLEIDNAPLLKSEHDRSVAEISQLNYLTEAQLRLGFSTERKASLNETYPIAPRLIAGAYQRTEMADIYRSRKSRRPFLFAAKCVASEFLSMNFEGSRSKGKLIPPNKLISQISDKVNNQPKFEKLCGTAKAIAPQIAMEWSKAVDAALANVESELPHLDPIPSELVPEKAPRRSAAETTKGSRQRVAD